MRDQIEILASLQNVDRDIKEKSEARGTLLREIRKREEEIEAKKAEVEAFRSEWKDRDRLRQEKERMLQEESKKAMEKRMRMSRIKNLKELQALQREIDQIRQGNAQLEEDLIGLMEDLEARVAGLREKDEEIKKLAEETAQKRGQIEEQLAGIERAVTEASHARGALAEKVSGDLIKRYELIFSRRGGVAVVAVFDGICQGCHMNIPPQLFNEIRKSDKLNLCPSCHRILYYKPTVPSEKQV